MNFQVFAGAVIPGHAVSSFENGYTLGVEYTNYYSDHLGFVGHLSGTYNQINQDELVNGELLNSWFLLGGKVGTGTILNPIRLYGLAMIGGNYMMPMNGLDQVSSSFNLAYSGGGGVVIRDLVHIGVRYHNARQKVSTSSREEIVNSSYLSLILGVQF